jgi:hypothetical protein
LPGQLYDLNRDPGEKEDLFSRETGIARELSAILAERRGV